MNRSILLVFAHPDDESFGLAGTILKYTRQGVPVDLICATRGEKGSRLDVPDGVETGVARGAELRVAAGVIGIRNIYFLDFIDGELRNVDRSEIVARVLAIMRQVAPEVVVTFGPDGITGHPDHVAIGDAATDAFQKLVAAGDGPRKLYFVTLPKSVVPSEEFGITTRPDDEVTTAIDVASYVDKKIQAISAHWSQQDARDFVPMLRKPQNAGLGAKEYLYLAYPRTSAKETDLFQ